MGLVWGWFGIGLGMVWDDRFGVGLGLVWGRFGVGLVWGRFGVGLGSVWGRFGVGLGLGCQCLHYVERCEE